MNQPAQPPTQAGPADAPRPLLGPWQVAAAYCVLLVGFALIGFASQGADVVAGLWITEALAIALPAVIWLRSAGVRPAGYFGLGAPTWRWVAIAVVTAVLNQPIVALLEQLAHSTLPAAWVLTFDQYTANLEAIFRQRAVGMTLTVVIAAPLGEELFFRGFALPALARRRALAAALVSGALFSLMHFNGVGFLGLWEIGVWLAVLRWGSGSLWTAVLGHALNNAIAAGSFLAGLQDPSEPPPLWVLASGAALLLAGSVLGVKVLRAATPVAAVEERVAAEAPAAKAPGQEAGAGPAVDHARSLALWLVWAIACGAGLWQLAGTLLRARR